MSLSTRAARAGQALGVILLLFCARPAFAQIDVRHAGLVVTGGAEVRVTRWIGVTGDVQYTHVTGILGSGGISKDLGESDFGGVAGRVRVIIGR